MKEGDVVQVECNLMGLCGDYLNDGLDPQFNIESFAPDLTSALFTIELISFDMGKTSYNMTLQDRVDEANRVKNAGTSLFRKQLYKRALEKYESANQTLHPVSDDPTNFRPVHLALLANITLCHMKMEQWHEGATFAGKILEQNPAEVKALYRRGQCKRNMSDLFSAAEDLNSAKEILEGKTDENSKAQLRDVIKELQIVRKITKDYHAKEKKMFSNILK